MSGGHLEQIALVAPFGVRLRDVVTGQVVDGVEVQLVSAGTSSSRVTVAVRTPSGVYAAQGLRGLRQWERRDVGPDGLPEGAEIPPLPFRVEVRDGTGRFHSFAVGAVLPIDGLLDPPSGSPPGSPPRGDDRSVPMFSLPARPVPAVTAVVRARLALVDGTPAAYAALDVVPREGAVPVRGIADRRGEVVVLFPYPRPPGLVGSPPSGTRTPLSRTTWRVTLQAHLPATVSPPADGELPDLRLFLEQSPTPMRTTTSPARELREETLTFGRELVLRSSPADPTVLVGA